MLEIKWPTTAAAGLFAALTIWFPVEEAAKFTLILYLIYLTGFFFLRNFYQSYTLEQNTLSIIVGSILISAGSYAIKMLNVPYTRTTFLFLAGTIIAASALLEQMRKRKIHGTPKRRKAK